jgi:hypothetical protein
LERDYKGFPQVGATGNSQIYVFIAIAVVTRAITAPRFAHVEARGYIGFDRGQSPLHSRRSIKNAGGNHPIILVAMHFAESVMPSIHPFWRTADWDRQIE